MRLACLLILAAGGAAAGPVCLPRAELMRIAQERLGETPAHVGLAVSGGVGTAVIEVLTAPDGGWTILRSDARGMSCVIAAGEAWQPAPPPPPEGDPS